jgi:hypothetical protein
VSTYRRRDGTERSSVFLFLGCLVPFALCCCGRPLAVIDPHDAGWPSTIRVAGPLSFPAVPSPLSHTPRRSFVRPPSLPVTRDGCTPSFELTRSSPVVSPASIPPVRLPRTLFPFPVCVRCQPSGRCTLRCHRRGRRIPPLLFIPQHGPATHQQLPRQRHHGLLLAALAAPTDP